jgi:hypothetical protein
MSREGARKEAEEIGYMVREHMLNSRKKSYEHLKWAVVQLLDGYEHYVPKKKIEEFRTIGTKMIEELSKYEP